MTTKKIRLKMKTLNLIKSKLIQNKSYDSYLLSLNSHVRGLYRNNLSLYQFVDEMMSTVESNLIQAWNSGASDCGFKPSEFSVEELAVRDNYIKNQFRYILGLGQSIRQDHNVVRIGEMLSRAEMWANRWYEMQALASQTMCGDLKMMWVWDPYKEHCGDCRKLNGRVYRNSTWLKYGIRPGSAELACFGGHCGCRFKRTSKAITPGRPPVLSKRK